MGARAVLEDLRGAGLSVNLIDDKIVVAPKAKLTDPLREAIRAYRDDLAILLKPSGTDVTPMAKAAFAETRACAGLRHGTCGEPVAAELAEKFVIVWAPEGHADICPAYSAKAPADASRSAYRLSKADADRCHTPSWDDAEVAVFTERVLRFVRRGVAAADADDLAERLTLRDREQDDHRLCLECVHLKANGRCAAAHAGQLPGVDLHIEPVQTQLWRCEGFAELAAQ